MSKTTAGPAPGEALTQRQTITVMVGLMLGMFLSSLDQTIVSTSIYTIANDLDGLSLQAWATTAYLITSTVTTPLYGKLSDIFGRRPLYLAAIVIFLAGSLYAGSVHSMTELAIARGIQGMGAGGLLALALTIIGDIVALKDRAKFQGYFMSVFGISSVLGPVVGGAFAGSESILGFDGWRWVFFINLPIGLAALAVVFLYLHLPAKHVKQRIDYWGAAAITLAIVPLLLVAEQGRSWGWTSVNSFICYGLGVLGIIAFLLAERRAGDYALIPLRLFRNVTFGLSSLLNFIIGIGMFGAIAMLPMYLQLVKGLTPTEAGLMMITFTVGIPDRLHHRGTDHLVVGHLPGFSRSSAPPS
jgi:EmrB/QacA subfamily drug resistance transporter